MPRNVAYGSQRGTSDLACALSDFVGDRKDLVRLFIQQQMVVTELSTGHVPVEILRLYIKAERVGQQLPQHVRNIAHRLAAQPARDPQFLYTQIFTQRVTSA